MAWPNPFRRHTPNTKSHFGYVFEWTDDHLSEEECLPLRHSYDVLGEKALQRLNEISPPPQKGQLPRNRDRTAPKATEEQIPLQHPSDQSKPADHARSEKTAEEPAKATRDLCALLTEHHDSDPVLSELWTQLNTVPDWVDWDQIARGQDVFYRYGGANLTGLAYQSLLGGMGAARVVETLARTGGFSVKVARHRLFETTQHILQVTKSLESIQPGGEGWASTIRVRLLHAAVRNRILDLEKSRPGYYNVSEWGVPINDLDSMATISTFSATLLYMSLPRQGIFPRAREETDYIALWRYVGYLIGCPVSPYFATPQKAKAVMQTLYLREIQPSDTGRLLANNIIQCLADQPPGYASAEFLSASARWLNGPYLSDALGLQNPSFYYSVLMAGQCLFFCFYIYTSRSVESWDRKKVDLLRRVFWAIVVESKYGLKGEETGFEFKYVPEFGTITEMGESKGRLEGEKATYDVERRNLKTVAIAGVVVVLGAWIGIKVGMAVLRTGLNWIS